MYSLVKPLLIRKKLLERKIKVFTRPEFTRMFQLAPYQAEYFLRQLIKEDLLIRFKKGLYAIKTDLPGEEEIANVLYKPSYISFEYALAYYGLIPEMVYSITSATTKPTRLFTIESQTFSYFTIKKEAYIGYILAERGQKRFYIAEPEKAIIDYLYFVALGQRFHNDRMKTEGLNRKKIAMYTSLYKKDKLNEIVKELELI